MPEPGSAQRVAAITSWSAALGKGPGLSDLNVGAFPPKLPGAQSAPGRHSYFYPVPSRSAPFSLTGQCLNIQRQPLIAVVGLGHNELLHSKHGCAGAEGSSVPDHKQFFFLKVISERCFKVNRTVCFHSHLTGVGIGDVGPHASFQHNSGHAVKPHCRALGPFKKRWSMPGGTESSRTV